MDDNLKNLIDEKKKELNDLIHTYHENILLSEWKQYEKHYVFCTTDNPSLLPDWQGFYGYVDNIGIDDITGKIIIKLLYGFMTYNFSVSEANRHIEEIFLSPLTICECPDDINLHIMTEEEYSKALNDAITYLKKMYTKIN